MYTAIHDAFKLLFIEKMLFRMVSIVLGGPVNASIWMKLSKNNCLGVCEWLLRKFVTMEWRLLKPRIAILSISLVDLLQSVTASSILSIVADIRLGQEEPSRAPSVSWEVKLFADWPNCWVYLPLGVVKATIKDKLPITNLTLNQ